LDTITEISQPAASEERDKFIPVRKEDIFSALIRQDDFADSADCELFWRFARTLRTICHYEYSETLDRLRDDYYYFNPEVASLAAIDLAKRDFAYNDLIKLLDKVLKDANFAELPHEEIVEAHRKRTVPVKVKAEHDDFREVRFYKRGHHVERFEIREWFGLRRREVEIEVFDDIVLVVAMKTQTEIGSRRELRILKRRKIVPGSVLLKYFRNIACGDLYALFPNARVVMSNFDKAFLGVPAIAGGIPILIKLYATISVLFLVAGIYLGGSGSVADADMKAALAALMGIVALGGFGVRQWLKYKHQTLKYHMELTENMYFRNVNNNAGIFDYLIATAEDQETKEAALAYHFIRKAEMAPTATEVQVVSRRGLRKISQSTLISKLPMRSKLSIALDSYDVRANASSSCHSNQQSPNCTRFGTIFSSVSSAMGPFCSDVPCQAWTPQLDILPHNLCPELLRL
jgi:hypothetical protein